MQPPTNENYITDDNNYNYDTIETERIFTIPRDRRNYVPGQYGNYTTRKDIQPGPNFYGRQNPQNMPSNFYQPQRQYYGPQNQMNRYNYNPQDDPRRFMGGNYQNTYNRYNSNNPNQHNYYNQNQQQRYNPQNRYNQYNQPNQYNQYQNQNRYNQYQKPNYQHQPQEIPPNQEPHLKFSIPTSGQETNQTQPSPQQQPSVNFGKRVRRIQPPQPQV